MAGNPRIRNRIVEQFGKHALGVVLKRMFLVAGLMSVAPFSPIVAADLAPRIFTKAPPAPDNWSGGYVGLSGGFGTGNSKQTDPGRGPLVPGGGGGGPPPGDGSYAVNGGLIGGTIGYNWQIARWVYGFEGDYSWADISGRSDQCGLSANNAHACGTKLSSLGTLRGRVGYAVGAAGNWLLFATGGLAVGEVRGWDVLTPASGSELRPGWTVGAGVETKFAPNWSAKVEYLYVDLGKSALFDILPSTPETVSFNANIVRAGINYKLPVGKIPTGSFSPEPARNWSGLYIGGHVGGSSAGSNWAFQRDDLWIIRRGTGGIPFARQTSVLGGVQAGYNFQLGSIVTGIEGTWSGLNHKTTIASPYYPDTDTETAKISNIFTIAGRLGVTWDRVLFYAKGGWAGGEVGLSAASTSGGPSAWNPGSKFRSGVIVGAGFEYMLTQNLILGIEYNHIDLGRANYTAYNTGADTTLTSVDDKTKLDTVVGRLSYKFDSLGAVASR